MRTSGSGLLLAILAVVVVLIVAVLLFFVPLPNRRGGGTPASAVKVSTTLVRNPAGLSAVVTIVNGGSQDLRGFDITRLVIAGMGGGPPMPYTVGPVRQGGSVSVTIPFRGPAPAPNALVSFSIDYTYRKGWFGKGAGSSAVTSNVP